MGMVYIAANGDGIGEQIGNAIMSDDHQALSGLSRKFKEAHSNIEKWAQKKGGEIVASSGDEVIFSIPEEALNELESVKDTYAQASGTTLTIGIGQTISQASKALIYGKLNDKNQIVEYEPQMDDYISNDEEPDVEEDLDEEESANVDTDDTIPSPEDIDDSASEESRQQEGVGQEFDDEDEDEDEEESEEDSDEPAHEQSFSPEENMVHDAEENEDDEQDSDNIEADEEPEVFGGNTEPEDEDFAEDAVEDVENQDLDQESEDEESLGDEDEIPDLSDEDLASYGEEEIPEEESEEEFQEGEEEYPEDEEFQNEPQEENKESDMDSEADSFLNEMMHSNVEGEDQDADQAELKQKIMVALQSIKDNREILDQIKVQNPALYEGIIANMQSMIEMGKKLGMDSQPEMEEQPQDFDQQPEMEEQDPSMMGDEMEEAPVKKPQGSFPA
jgi:hypothetical protein